MDDSFLDAQACRTMNYASAKFNNVEIKND